MLVAQARRTKELLAKAELHLHLIILQMADTVEKVAVEKEKEEMAVPEVADMEMAGMAKAVRMAAMALKVVVLPPMPEEKGKVQQPESLPNQVQDCIHLAAVTHQIM